MQVSEKTIDILKNFSSINNGLVLKVGNVQRTMSVDECILAEATVDQFPSEFGIYDLPKFLTNLSLLKTPNLDFSGNIVNMTDQDGFSLSYRAAPVEAIISPPEGAELGIENPDVVINLTVAQLQKLLKVASINEFTHFTVFGKKGKLGVKIEDKKNDTSNSGVLELGEHTGSDFEAVFKTEQLKILPLDYTVSIQKDAYALFDSKDGTIKYFISLEA